MTVSVIWTTGDGGTLLELVVAVGEAGVEVSDDVFVEAGCDVVGDGAAQTWRAKWQSNTGV